MMTPVCCAAHFTPNVFRGATSSYKQRPQPSSLHKAVNAWFYVEVFLLIVVRLTSPLPQFISCFYVVVTWIYQLAVPFISLCIVHLYLNTVSGNKPQSISILLVGFCRHFKYPHSFHTSYLSIVHFVFVNNHIILHHHHLRQLLSLINNHWLAYYLRLVNVFFS